MAYGGLLWPTHQQTLGAIGHLQIGQYIAIIHIPYILSLPLEDEHMVGIYGTQTIAIQAQRQGHTGRIFVEGIRVLGMLGRSQQQALGFPIGYINFGIELHQG